MNLELHRDANNGHQALVSLEKVWESVRGITLSDNIRSATADMAKYPFLPEAKQHISLLDVDLAELAELEGILARAKERVTAAFEVVAYLSQEPRTQLEVEVASFPVSIVIVAAIKENALSERFALLEAKKIYEYLLHERTDDGILTIAKFFNWKIQKTKETPHELSIHFTDYLKNATLGRLVHSSEWKLVNRYLHKNQVFITRKEACRLLQEEVQGHIETLTREEVQDIPPNVQKVIDDIKASFMERKPHLAEFDMVVQAEESEYPPCVKNLIARMIKGQHLSHVERITLVTYLLHQGISIDGIVNIFANASDFQEDKTRYQIEHLAGQRGSGSAYKTYNCSTLKTHGVCAGSEDTVCRKIRNPLTYHLRPKRGNLSKKRGYR